MLEFKERYLACQKKGDPHAIDFCEQEVREEYRGMGPPSDFRKRYTKMADQVHSFLSYCDLENLRKYKDTSLVEVADEYGVVEELRKFPE